MRVFSSPDELRDAIGETLGVSDWLAIDQERIDAFASATGDLQWIHVDPLRAASGPFGRTVPHGYLTLSLLPFFTRQIFTVEGTRLTVNYGLDRVRFVSPVRVGVRARARSTIVEVTDVADATQVVVSTTVEVESAERPALVAETISRYYT